jgi:hypothetical protein
LPTDKLRVATGPKAEYDVVDAALAGDVLGAAQAGEDGSELSLRASKVTAAGASDEEEFGRAAGSHVAEPSAAGES